MFVIQNDCVYLTFQIEKFFATRAIADVHLIQEAKLYHTVKVRNYDDQFQNIYHALHHNQKWRALWSPENTQKLGWASITTKNGIFSNCRRKHWIERIPTINTRYCMSKFELEGKSILLISFHGEHNSLSNVQKTEKLKRFLQDFYQLKEKLQCDHLIIGGDFNLDLDEVYNENWNFLQSRLNLKIVPYKSQRCYIQGSRKSPIYPRTNLKKIDGLICDMDIQVQSVVVYTDKIVRDFSDPNTTVVKSGLERHLMDHHPILFKLMLPVRKNRTRGRQLPRWATKHTKTPPKRRQKTAKHLPKCAIRW